MTTQIAKLKEQAAEKAVESIESGMVVGLGTGSTAVYATRAIGRLLQDGRLANIVTIPTSEKTAEEAKKLAIPLTTLKQHPEIDITIDGADEVAPNLDVIKGLGGALLREKIVATASKKLIIVADNSKIVTQLGMKAPVPVEVIPFAVQPVFTQLQKLGADVKKRRQKSGDDFYLTDENNIILDCHFENGIADPQSLAQTMIMIPGVVEHGLFLNMANQAIIASSDGITILDRNR